MRILSNVVLSIIILPLLSQAVINSVVSCKAALSPQATILDGLAGWGTKLLPSEVFRENRRYQQNMNLIINSDSTIVTPYWSSQGSGLNGKFDPLMKEWSILFSDTINSDHQPYSYAVLKNGVEHHLSILELRSSGTEANNYFYELAAHAFQKRTGKKAKRPQLLFFADPKTGLFPYGGTHGRSAEMSLRYTTKPQETLDHYLVPSPQTKYLENIPPGELIRLRKIEDQAIQYIRKQVANDSLEVGGIILEPISVSQGIHFYRKEFLLRLRNLADELGIPIMADEVFTGGGRTGKFWAFQHYDGFFPDLISFGKGLELKGVGWIERKPINKSTGRIMGRIWDFPRFEPYRHDPANSNYDLMRLDNTSIASAADVARALVVIETIGDNNLVKHAESEGKAILANVRAKAVELGLSPDKIQGIGLVFHFSNYIDLLFPKNSLINFEGRVTPYITNKLSDWPSYLNQN